MSFEAHFSTALTRAKRLAPLLAVTGLFVAFRLPALMNAGALNSDGAVTGLQALQMLRGEWQLLHWGRDYLTSIDSVMAIPLFVLFGATPLTLMVTTLLGQTASALFAHAVLAKRIGPWPAVIAVLPLVFMTMALNIYLFFDIRQWCLALVLCSFWLLDGASESRRPLLRYGAGIAAGVLATFLDLYAIQFIGGLAVFAVLCALDDTSARRQVLQRLGVVVGAAAMAWLVVLGLRYLGSVSTGRAAWSMQRVEGNARLLLDTTLPWVIGLKVFYLGTNPYPDLWAAPKLYGVVQALGAIVLGCAFALAGGAFFVKRVPWTVRRLGVLGLAVASTSVVGFLGSFTATDIWGARLLAPVVLAVPFALAPAAFLLRGWRFPTALFPYLVSLLVGGWLSYGTFVDGPIPRRTPRGVAAEELQVAQLLRDRGVEHAAAHYWLAYRLTFIFQERPVVVPLDSEDRYPRYRAAYEAAPVVAWIFHPSQPWLAPELYEGTLKQAGARYERIQLFDFTVFIVHRRG